MAFRADTNIGDIVKMSKDTQRPENAPKTVQNWARQKRYDSFRVKLILEHQHNLEMQITAAIRGLNESAKSRALVPYVPSCPEIKSSCPRALVP